MPDEIRAFLALEIPGPVKDAVAEHQARWKVSLPRARWVRPDNQHLTIKFLGSVTEARLARLTTRLGPELAVLGPVRVALGSTGCFPSPWRTSIATQWFPPFPRSGVS